jgi:hypothetical protein
MDSRTCEDRVATRVVGPRASHVTAIGVHLVHPECGGNRFLWTENTMKMGACDSVCSEMAENRAKRCQIPGQTVASRTVT